MNRKYIDYSFYPCKLQVKFDNQLEKEHLGIGTDSWVFVAALEQERDYKPFFQAVRSFYIKSIQKMIHLAGFMTTSSIETAVANVCY